MTRTTIIPVMSGYTSTFGSVIYSADVVAGLSWRAFNRLIDGGTNTYWRSDAKGASSSYIGYNFKEKVVVDSYSIRATTIINRAPKSWIFQGSNNGSIWEDIDARSNISFSSLERKEFSFDNKVAYNRYRVLISSAQSSTTYVEIQEIEMFEYIYTPINKTLILHDGEYKKFNEGKEATEANTSLNLVPEMTSKTSPSGLVFNTTAYGSNYEGDFAFRQQGVNSEGFITANGTVSGILGYKFNSQTIINKYSIQASTFPSYVNYVVKSWTLEASNDTTTGLDGNWKVLHTANNQIGWTAGEIREYEFENENPFIAYRINITGSNSTSYSTVYRFNMFYKSKGKPRIYGNWSTVSSTLPSQEQFLSEGMDSLSPLLDRRVEALEPLSMEYKSNTLPAGEGGKAFSKTIDLKKYIDIRSISLKTE